MIEKNRGGPGRNQGRKPISAGENTVTISIRVTESQKEKLSRISALIGISEWVRRKIDKEVENEN